MNALFLAYMTTIIINITNRNYQRNQFIHWINVFHFNISPYPPRFFVHSEGIFEFVLQHMSRIESIRAWIKASVFLCSSSSPSAIRLMVSEYDTYLNCSKMNIDLNVRAISDNLLMPCAMSKKIPVIYNNGIFNRAIVI